MSHSRKDCITFFMTTQCNLVCDYCYLKETKLPKESINVDFAKTALRDYFEKNSSRHIRFFGAGEPTLEFKKIVEIKNYAYELAGEDLICEIQTNGVFSKEIADWLSSNMKIIWISFDGPPQYNDKQRFSKNRNPVTSIVERNVRHLISSGTGVFVGVRPTITALTVENQIDLIDYFYELGVRYVYSDPVFPAVNSDINNVARIPSYSDFLMRYAQSYLAAREKAIKLEMFYGTILAVNFDEHTEIACRSCLPSPHITTDGYVTCCDMSYMKDILPELVYGKFDPQTGEVEYYKNRIATIKLRRASNLVDCKDCEVLFNCAGGCLGEGLNETGNLLGVKKDYCDAIRFLARELPLNKGVFPCLHP